MDITLEMIDDVTERTGASYKDAKEALEATGGNVIDAIIAIEEAGCTGWNETNKHNESVMEKVKEAIKKGNVSKIMVKRDDEVILNISVTLGVVGAIFAPLIAIGGLVVALGKNCTIEIVKTDNEVVNVGEIIVEKAKDVKEKGEEILDHLKKE